MAPHSHGDGRRAVEPVRGALRRCSSHRPRDVEHEEHLRVRAGGKRPRHTDGRLRCGGRETREHDDRGDGRAEPRRTSRVAESEGAPDPAVPALAQDCRRERQRDGERDECCERREEDDAH
jgi:hypothetical protein